MIVNLTIPAVHAEVSLRCLDAGKHVYSEKPLAVTTAEGQAVLDRAAAKNLRVGNAPDTFLGTAHQACRRAIERGDIGTPVAATAFMLSAGHESWHPDPDFYYQPGGGPMFDMGPYYLTALINMLGPVTRVSGEAAILVNPRTITSAPKRGTEIQVNTPDHVAGTLRFAGGCLGTIVTSFATKIPSYDSRHPIVIYGTAGTLKVPDPNNFDGQPLIRTTRDDPAWGDAYRKLDVTHTHPNGRSLGVADMATAIRSGRDHRANERVAFCVLETMEGLLAASADGRYIEPRSGFTKPAPMPEAIEGGVLDE